MLNIGKNTRTYQYVTPQEKQIEVNDNVRGLGITPKPNRKFR